MQRNYFSILFFIRRTRLLKNGEAPIGLRITVNGQRAELQIKRSVPEKQWNAAKGCAIGKDRKTQELNQYLEMVRTPQLRDKVKELLDKARKAGAIIYYDVNFRSTHAHEAIKLMPTILENFEYADIVRGSTEDFGHMFGMTDADKVYQHKIGFYCPRFICTNGGESLSLRTRTLTKNYPVKPLQTVSAIGAGDNFNAGLVFGLLKNRIRKADLDELTEADWDKIIASGMSFSRQVCASFDNYISKEFAAQL